ncbi:Uncharacterised protein [Acetobacterium wieringae]|uniref:helix-turn-helix domain-containing protein n=1 Tax=Acetobacterium wieringae TaxID=52694 RepID=UPI001DB6191B|nr:helix-turn-helix transcriptional regulator [Acetobacterium wieringae]VUZ28488.1 Uncharacterised protein [Acetobacterium wieringae]
MVKGMGSKIKDLLDSQGLRVTDLSRKTGIPVNTLYSMLNRDQTNEKIETLSKIADALEISLSDLLGQTDPKEEQTMNEQAKTTDQEMKERFRQLFFKLSEASESDDCTADDLMTITQAMLSIYPMFRTLV